MAADAMVGHHLQLLGSFRACRAGHELFLPHKAQRVVAFLSVKRGQHLRPYVAGSLWPNTSEDHALGSLRSALWRLRKVAPRLIEADAHTVALAAGTSTDVEVVADRARGLCGADRHDLPTPDYVPFTREFLPGWYDNWVLAERERMRQLCLHALESIAAELMDRREYPMAIQVLLSVISLDEFRESPRRQLISIHLAEGNASEAIRLYQEYERILRRELGLRPSARIRDLIDADRAMSATSGS